MPCAAGVTARKARNVKFGDAEVVEIESYVSHPRIINASHDPGYTHTPEYKMLLSFAEALKARVRANAWHQEVCIEYGLKPDLGVTADGNRHHVGQAPFNVAAAIHEPGVRRWLVDTGCPFDLIAHKELDAHEESFIKKATKLIRLWWFRSAYPCSMVTLMHTS